MLLRYFTGLRRRLQLDDEALAPEEVQEQVEPEPEDINPERIEEPGPEDLDDDHVLDSSDDEIDENELITFESVLPPGMRVAAPPSAPQLEFKNAAGKELKDKSMMYNWPGLGWCAGWIRRPSGDKNKLLQVNGQRLPANFIISYDDTEGPHCLTIHKYGKGQLSQGDRWVLLEHEPADSA